MAVREASPHEFPAVAQLLFDGIYPSAGVLIDDQWVLTAAHVADGFSSVKVLLGAQHSDHPEPGRVELHSSHITIHEGFDPHKLAHDIALIRLPRPVERSAQIAPIQRIRPAANLPGHVLTIAGWGRSQLRTPYHPRVMVADAPILDNALAEQSWGSGTIAPSHICVDSAAGTVFGAGIPLLSRSGPSWDLVGLGCLYHVRGIESGLPVLFTRADAYQGWITAHTARPTAASQPPARPLTLATEPRHSRRHRAL